jgi:hypothetical protein
MTFAALAALSPKLKRIEPLGLHDARLSSYFKILGGEAPSYQVSLRFISVKIRNCGQPVF